MAAKLSLEEVEKAYASLQARVQTALDDLESKKGVAGWVSGQNNEITRTEGALRNIGYELGPWSQSGRDLAANEVLQTEVVTLLPKTGGFDNALRSGTRADRWAEQGQDFADAISKIDGYGRDATLEAVLARTVSQTAKDIKEKVVPALSFGIGFGLVAAIVAIAIFISMKARA